MHPIATDPADRLDHLGEVALLARVPDWLGPAAPPPPAGPGDDTAVLPDDAPRFNVVTVDSLVRGRHFTDDLAPEHVGAKLVKRNLSDLAAMGARPGGAVVALFLPGSTSVAWLERFYRGMGATAYAHGLAIQGGDVAASTLDWAASMTVWGSADQPALRAGARPGDGIWVTGDLGGTLASHHWAFEPRLQEGAWLAARPELRSMMDLTDGLGKDLPALMGPDLAARLQVNALPARDAAAQAAAASGHPPLWHVLNDGEDYELLFTLAGSTDDAGLLADWSRAFPTVRLTRIGTVIPRESGHAAIQDAVSGIDLTLGRGYEHFAP